MIRVFTIVRNDSSTTVKEVLATAVSAKQTYHRNVIDELAQIAGNVGSPSRIKGFAGHLHNRHRCLRRNAADFSPNEFIQHQIADYHDSFGRRAVEDAL